MISAIHPRLAALERTFQFSPLQIINDPLCAQRGVELWIKRDDLLHPVISGNKWRKLKYILNHVLSLPVDTVVSMGGAYSNHLHALAYAGRELGLHTTAFIRGEQPEQLNPTLADLQAWGMNLQFTPRSDYLLLRGFHEHDALPGLKANEYWLPEGGATALALQGVAEIVSEIEMAYDVLAVACGTATTMAGLAAAATDDVQVLGVAALKGGDYLTGEVKSLLAGQSESRANWRILTDYHGGGFAKASPELLEFIRAFQSEHGIPLEPIYTGKLFYALFDLIRNGFFKHGQRIVALHSGGLQGWRNAK